MEYSSQQYQKELNDYKAAIDACAYSKAREILERVLLAPDTIVDGKKPEITIDMKLNYALCLARYGEFENAINFAKQCENDLDVKKCKKLNSLSNLSRLEKLCLIYALCTCCDIRIKEIIVGMGKRRVEFAPKFLRKLALTSSFTQQYDLALWLYELALEKATIIQDGALINKIKTGISNTKRIKQDGTTYSAQYFGSFMHSKKEFIPGMIIGVYPQNIDKKTNPWKPDSWNDSTMPFVVWKADNDYVYAFPLAFPKGNERQLKMQIPGVNGARCLKDHSYKLPKVPDVIYEIQQTIPRETFLLAIERMYENVTCWNRWNGLSHEGGLANFVAELTRQRIPSEGGRLIISQRHNSNGHLGGRYYYVTAVDPKSKECEIVPLAGEADIRLHEQFRIPYDHEDIFAKIGLEEPKGAKIREKLSTLDSSCVNRFCKFNGQTYLITGEDDTSYLGVNTWHILLGCREQIEYLPKCEVDLTVENGELELGQILEQYISKKTGKQYVREPKTPKKAED